ncbi:glycoside hydrolase family 16 protein [Phanerochaete carnosa HHB-10118-sp]|uniref:Glycoside hydrolase family 16 protein n=1 Tax=Phanerochaete carnosa (strain HHB-10118-sp) TaxID=650164 RepID=K5W2A1_PHACS|nr:glycoside hydrolase family 16 protein [Phanerochaete carnosa HHB-10118-sp]EKM57978.1 glycoside hydrolase family 16 protein [Phanerochaete carnosa HHB-10118-sp]
MPEPVCQDAIHTFPDLSRIVMNTTYYDGNATEYDWTLDKGSIINTNSSGGELALLLTETNGGTRLSSTRYLHYGTITARLKTGRWGGVVTAFITMSDIKDEIDWEFPGNATTEGQTNYFWQGNIPAWPATHGATIGNLSFLTDTFETYHDFTIDWQIDTLTWLIDGHIVHQVVASDTVVNGTSNYPNTPSRIQLSLWPAGIPSEPTGTVSWAGGMINWQDPDYLSAGHFYALIQGINVTCHDPAAATNDTTGYVYGTNQSAFTPSVAFSNASTINAARGMMAGAAGPVGVWTIACAVVFSLVGTMSA